MAPFVKACQPWALGPRGIYTTTRDSNGNRQAGGEGAGVGRLASEEAAAGHSAARHSMRFWPIGSPSGLGLSFDCGIFCAGHCRWRKQMRKPCRLGKEFRGTAEQLALYLGLQG
ncbi:hypothetical protein MPNT_230041 [Candidatus Methylacidithermus pantelleriae]|uniref:Uncharacterized protein n=1 Tax=Candidatus Methylacidithermus pantelleriae TaxID=2744239 RepID=A0A8J2BJP1_9BACT|nr:hypothetical protein MPNT_230041 [Candidatus Methylacidithermus pantelleriae]